MPGYVSEEAEEEVSPLLTQRRLRTVLREELLACLYQAGVGSWEKLVMMGPVPPPPPTNRTRPPVTSERCFCPKDKMPDGRGWGKETSSYKDNIRFAFVASKVKLM